MDSAADKDWKSSIGFPINYESTHSSDDDFDTSDVVLRRRPGPRSSRHLLEDGGDGAPADLLGTTPPRARIRSKEKRKSHIFADGEGPVQRVTKETRRNTTDNLFAINQTLEPQDRSRSLKRASLKAGRTRERDWKLSTERDSRSDSLPAPAADSAPAVPTFVESCSRFMSLTSRLKCRAAERPLEPPGRPPASRVHFHNTFSMLISMGNVDRGCRRTISREEQVWQNELKDLIWLELQARVAGRSLAQQDAFLCTQRLVVPTIISNIINYRFVNEHPCRSQSPLKCPSSPPAAEDPTSPPKDEVIQGEENEDQVDGDGSRSGGCVSFSCGACARAVGAALREVGLLLDSFHHAVALFPSTKAMTHDHPLAATVAFNDRLKAMCLWYNSTQHLRMKTCSLRRLLRRARRPAPGELLHSNKSEARACQVRFQVDAEARRTSADSASSPHTDLSAPTTPEPEGGGVGVESGVERGTHGSTVDTSSSAESGYLSEKELLNDQDDLCNVSECSELTNLRLLNKCEVSPFRYYLHELLKTQGVRRSVQFVQAARATLARAQRTLERDTDDATDDQETETTEEQKTDEDKEDAVKSEETKQLRRYGWWSPENAAMRLPSYRGDFLLLSAACIEVLHDYLQLRLEGRPRSPSSFTVKQILHELKEGLDIATEMRATFVRSIEVALDGYRPGPAARQDLLLIIRNFDATVDAVLKQYLAYLRVTSQEAVSPRAHWEREWSFAARLAQRVPCAAIAPAAFTDIVCNQIEIIVRRFKQKFIDLSRHEEHAPADGDDEDAKRRFVYAICREAQCIYTSERENTLQTAQLARVTAARLAAAAPPLAAAIFDSLMSMRNVIAAHTETILERSSRDDNIIIISKETSENLAARSRELLLQVFKLGFELHRELHRFVNVCSERGRGRRRLARAESTVEDYDDRPFGVADDAQQNQSRIEQLLSAPLAPPTTTQAPPTTTQQATPTPTPEAAAVAARAIVAYARCWMCFVVQRCERGRGLRPRWASQGLEFLMLACDPNNTRHLTDEEFEELKSEMDSCISHVVGARAPPSPARRPRRLQSPLNIMNQPNNTSGSLAPASETDAPNPPTPPVNVVATGQSGEQEVPPPPTPPSEPQPLLDYHGDETTAFSRRVSAACALVDAARAERLRSARAVGTVRSVASSLEPKLRQVTFKWQRGLKIGQGTFGKVYTVINTETGQLLAMKELSIGAGDRRALRRAANELRVLEGVTSPHLVRHYGCEVHREEMLIFMELCVEGSLEALLATGGALQEPAARRYTRQLVAAVAELHHRQIVHRDIKSGNIFLTNEGHCLKLGDFGCAVKIRANTTAIGELQGTVGTQAYMAPEVFMKSSGHGRAADIWSLGCVVTEMASGKRPFSEYDSNYQIMFVVGMGGRPDIPLTLSEEGQQFCRSCLAHEPELRPRADDLITHHFLNMKSEDDCKCETGYLITKM